MKRLSSVSCWLLPLSGWRPGVFTRAPRMLPSGTQATRRRRQQQARILRLVVLRRLAAASSSCLVLRPAGRTAVPADKKQQQQPAGAPPGGEKSVVLLPLPLTQSPTHVAPSSRTRPLIKTPLSPR